jgi:hypothetical protein
MSDNTRLDRLGLLHLKDKPEELARELSRAPVAGRDLHQGSLEESSNPLEAGVR